MSALKDASPSRPAILAALAVLLILLLPAARRATEARAALRPRSRRRSRAPWRRYQDGDLQGAIALLEPLRTSRAPIRPPCRSWARSTWRRAAPRRPWPSWGRSPTTDAAGPLILHNAARRPSRVGETEKAEKYLRRAVAKAPGSPAARDLGLLLGSEGRVAESYELLRPWAPAHPDDADAAPRRRLRRRRAPGARRGRGVPQGAAAGQPARSNCCARASWRSRTPRRAPSPSSSRSPRRHRRSCSPRSGATSRGPTSGSASRRRRSSCCRGSRRRRRRSPSSSAAPSTRPATRPRRGKVLAPFAKAALAAEDPTAPGDRAHGGRARARVRPGAAWRPRNGPRRSRRSTARRGSTPTALQAWQLLGRAQLAAGQRDAAAKSMAKVKELGGEKP